MPRTVEEMFRRNRDRGCLECWARPRVIHTVYGGDEDAPEPERCPACGRSLGVIIRVVEEEPPSEGEGLSC